ncbi:Lon protease [Candidatus Profftella armatura (Diaphorina cf. continua)]|uniref:Lon protease n=1 Tax=Candidatus Profftella armatura (Diaphorina cf. continua) TaxID=2661583 RepID=A0A7R6W0Q6_9PROT|nr:Lon protease [Candidatus Profftella armatura (Diaphorina cf. continua)]
MTNSKSSNEYLQLPLLVLQDIVIFPYMVMSLFVSRLKSKKALEAAIKGNETIIISTRKNFFTNEPSVNDIYKVGCVVNILQVIKLPDGNIKILIEGVQRVKIHFIDELNYYIANITPMTDSNTTSASENEAMRRTIIQEFDKYLKFNKKLSPEILKILINISDPSLLIDTIIAHLPLRVEQKQFILETPGVFQRHEHLISQLENELDILQIEKRIRSRIKRQMEKSNREYYLNEQVKAIQKELGEEEEGVDLEELEKKIISARMSKEAFEKAHNEFRKLRLMPLMSAEATVVRNYIDTLIALPWKKKSKINNSLNYAEKILEGDHYGLNKIKERILEYLAVQKRVNKLKAPILCFVGPPGVGKTSLGKSIAQATNRKFIRMALGGIKDEAEIRGHRRTYIGSMPGKIIQNISKVGVKNPLFLLDEIDKIGIDFRGDPASALLEVLDPEQNHTFSDNYIEVSFDLSDIMFIATSNSFNIPSALLDRMEVIRISGYTEDEKTNIAYQYLLPKQIKNNGLKKNEISISESVIRDIIRYYTREAGVRSLEREISKICRKVVKKILLKNENKKSKKIIISPKNINNFLGVRRFDDRIIENENRIGQVIGLAWTDVGGEILTIEAVIVPGKGKVVRTGTLGDVMKESIEAACTVVRSRANKLGIKHEYFEKNDIHIHVPEGATPKDGPSAGVAMTIVLISAFTGIPVNSNVAMTGEITLRGEILKIGGLKEKLLAAHQNGIKTVLIPEQNFKNLIEIPDNIKNNLNIIPVRWIDKAIEIALEHKSK